ncbi:hypothetical protein [Halobellus salinisoli]|uniref:hypothetical protein n=1 Tax=Halobellus salinisoli TaxID=3108500 RepID=UPI00300B2A2D
MSERSTDAEPDPNASPDTELPGTDDLRVAAVAAACTVGLTLLLQYGLDREVSLVWRLLPLGPYFLSLFTKRLSLGGLDTPQNWSLLTVAVTFAALLYFGFVV